MLRLRAGLVGDERGPLLGQPHELVRRVVEAGVHAVLEVGRRRDLHLLLLLGEHAGTMGAGWIGGGEGQMRWLVNPPEHQDVLKPTLET